VEERGVSAAAATARSPGTPGAGTALGSGVAGEETLGSSGRP
jgi:hypothetical protein